MLSSLRGIQLQKKIVRGVGEEDVGWWYGLILVALLNLGSLYLTAHSLYVWNYKIYIMMQKFYQFQFEINFHSPMKNMFLFLSRLPQLGVEVAVAPGEGEEEELTKDRTVWNWQQEQERKETLIWRYWQQ